jgi:ribose/xylose/arabinose/galactoside ABC-type transport system permease subunit
MQSSEVLAIFTLHLFIFLLYYGNLLKYWQSLLYPCFCVCCIMAIFWSTGNRYFTHVSLSAVLWQSSEVLAIVILPMFLCLLCYGSLLKYWQPLLYPCFCVCCVMAVFWSTGNRYFTHVSVSAVLWQSSEVLAIVTLPMFLCLMCYGNLLKYWQSLLYPCFCVWCVMAIFWSTGNLHITPASASAVLRQSSEVLTILSLHMFLYLLCYDSLLEYSQSSPFTLCSIFCIMTICYKILSATYLANTLNRASLFVKCSGRFRTLKNCIVLALKALATLYTLEELAHDRELFRICC